MEKNTELNSNAITKPSLGITELVLRDAHQSLLATRMRLDDMLPIAEQIDSAGYWSIESWGGATFDACIRYLNEDPWQRLRELKAVMPNTPQQMLLRGQNLLGYRHYADDLVAKFVERAAINGIDVFRIFDAMNDHRNMATAIKSVKGLGLHAQGTLSYTVSPVHGTQLWLDLARRLEDRGADSICIKDMAGLLTPLAGYKLVKELKCVIDVPIHLHSHATTGLSVATCQKCIEAGIDNIDAAISPMSMTYGHSPTETIATIAEELDRPTGLDVSALGKIAEHFRAARKKYSEFEGSLKGVDARILSAQVPGGMLTNMEQQLKEQGAADKLDQVLAEIPRVRKDLGYLPLVTPTSQIVGTQAVLNVLAGERYKIVANETTAVLRGEYGNTPAPVDRNLQVKMLKGEKPVRCRPADLLHPELTNLADELARLAGKKSLVLSEGDALVDDVLTYALFPQVAPQYFTARDTERDARCVAESDVEPMSTEINQHSTQDNLLRQKEVDVFTVELEGKQYTVAVSAAGDIAGIKLNGNFGQESVTGTSKTRSGNSGGNAEVLTAPMSGNVYTLLVNEGERVEAGSPLLIMEAMKMETSISAPVTGVIDAIWIEPGQAVDNGTRLLAINPAQGGV